MSTLLKSRPRQTRVQAVAEAIPALFALTEADGKFLRVKHERFGYLAVIFASPQVAGKFLSRKPNTRIAEVRVTQLRATCFEQITSWCKEGRCNGYWLVDSGNVQHDYPCDNIILRAVPDPVTGQFIVKGVA